MELRELKEQAGEYWAKGRFDQAEVLYRQILLLAPMDPHLWVRHAETLKRLGRKGDAVTSYQRAAQMLGEVGHFHRAIAAMRMALELKPDDIDLISELIRLEMKKNRKGTKTVEVPVVDLPAPQVDSQRLALPMLEETVTSPGITIEVKPPEYPLVRRLSERELAIRPQPEARWMVVSAEGPVSLRFVDELPDDSDD